MKPHEIITLVLIGVFYGLSAFYYFINDILKAIFWLLAAIAMIIIVAKSESDDI